MGTLYEDRAAALKAANDIVTIAKSAARELSTEEVDTVKARLADVEAIDLKIKAAEEANATLARLGKLAQSEQPVADDDDVEAKTLGEHFIKHCAQRLREVRGMKGASVGAPEFKAASDTQTTGGTSGIFGNVLTTVDRTIIPAVRPRLVVADLLGSGSISGQAITYFVEGAMEGAYTTVAEGSAKPQIHFVDPTTVTDALSKIAGFIKMTDEMIEDLDFVVSEINVRLLYELARFEETQLLSGDGNGTNISGILDRSGIQTETGTSATDNPDAIFRAITKVSTGAGLDADGIVIHPTDYQTLRLARDSNSQYYAGGYFQGQYGNAALLVNPPLWGLRTVVTPAITLGTCLVGAFATAATLYRKGGVRVESTNSHASDFTSNLVTIRAEERVALAVRRPAGFVNVTLSEPSS